MNSHLTTWENYAVSAASLPYGLSHKEREYFRLLKQIPKAWVPQYVMSTPLTAYLIQNNMQWHEICDMLQTVYIDDFEKEKFWKAIREYSETGRANRKYLLFPDIPQYRYKGSITFWRKVCNHVDDKNIWKSANMFSIRPFTTMRNIRVTIVKNEFVNSANVNWIHNPDLLGCYRHDNLTYMVNRI